MALLKPFRMSKGTDFERVIKEGERTQNSLFRIVCAKNQGSVARFGIVVSKKTAKRATRRNAMRRRISEVLRARFAENLAPHDIVVFVQAQATGRTYEELAAGLNQLFRKARLLKTT